MFRGNQKLHENNSSEGENLAYFRIAHHPPGTALGLQNMRSFEWKAMELCVVELGSLPMVSILDESEAERYAKSRGYEEPDPDQSNGFYDYLRTDPDTIVGIRWSPFPQAEFVLEKVPDSKLLKIVPNGILLSLRVWFQEPMNFDESISDDQLFWHNRIFLNASGDKAIITFALPERGSTLLPPIADA